MYSTISKTAYRQASVAAKIGKPQQQSPLLFPPSPDPYSAYLLLEEDEHDENGNSSSVSCCWGCCKGNCLRELPFPQDKCLTIQYSTSDGENSQTEWDRVYFIPVLGQPISSHCYYVVRAEGKHKGLVETCSTEEDMVTLCCCRYVKEICPRSLQPTNSNQQIQIISTKFGFSSKCIDSDAFPPMFLRRKNWTVVAKDMRGKHGRLAHVGGENTELRAQLPHFDFSVSQRRLPVVMAGEWYCPFIFINELGTRLEDPKFQLMESPFYKMDLEKYWEEIYSTQGMTGKDVDVDKIIKLEEVLLFGEEAIEEIRDNDGSVLFKGVGNQWGHPTGVKLSWPIIAKIRADQGRDGSEQGSGVGVKKSFSGAGMKGKFACYVVVERYVLKRMDGSIALTYSFRNVNQIQGKWEV
ncbi:hypothetical protein SUGI_0536860 [Cryptomeria japonica]|uniref:uncharacterized protein LOC131039502 n=1 Tax=Cryptomeria japonica TaxID=3369 RepID=UPI002408AFB7|nr:uncharacterized protein LOC131039502 [Cryptomeria japonica]GLJ27360.1 hypothetical protein SUGI_0536860 [Cryptomeria japonica]